MPGTQYFKDKQSNSLNSFINDEGAASWEPDTKYALEFKDAIDRVRNDLEEGILTKFRALRTRQLEGAVVNKCYENSSYTFNEAEECERFTFDNDFKLNQINNFWMDHISKHVRDYQRCVSVSDGQGSVADKDRAF